MKIIQLVRNETSSQGTFGTIFIEGKKFCRSIELPKDHDYDNTTNERNRECIPTGTYRVVPRSAAESAKFKYLHYILLDVPNRSHILIHIGNFAGAVEEGFKSDVEGCIALGKGIAVVQDQKIITESKTAFNEFKKVMGTEPFLLEITEDF